MMSESLSGYYRFWLSSKASNTRRAYEGAWADFLGFCGEEFMQEISRAQVAEWVADLRGRGLAVGTINLKVTAISSFYRYMADELGEVVQNPASGRSLRKRVRPYSDVEGLSISQVRDLLGAINRGSVQGKRDFALFLFYLATGRRNSEVRTLRRGDFRERGGGWQYFWRNKGGEGWDEVPGDVLRAVCEYLEAAGRPWGAVGEDAPIFVGLRGVDGAGAPLSARQVGKLLKRYARLAGIDGDVHPHTLRHTAAGLMDDAGDGPRAIQERLGHQSLDTTQLYLDRRHAGKNGYWERVRGQVLGGGYDRSG